MFSQCNHSLSGAQAREREEKLEESGEGRGKFSEESFPLPSPVPPPLSFQRLSTLSNPSPQLSLKQFGGRTELEKRHFLFYGFGKTFSLLLVSHRETNAKGQPYKPPATPLTLTKIFEEDGVGFGEGKLSEESFPFPSPIFTSRSFKTLSPVSLQASNARRGRRRWGNRRSRCGPRHHNSDRG